MELILTEKYVQVWDKKSFTFKTSLVGHTGSILALEYAEDKKWLFSSSGRYFLNSPSVHVLTSRCQGTVLFECVDFGHQNSSTLIIL